MPSGAATQLVRLKDALNAEFYKVSRRRMTYILLLSLAGLVLLFYLLLFLRIHDGPGTRRGTYFDWLAARSAMSFVRVIPYGLGLERFFATLMCVIFAGTMTGNEYDWRTVGVATARGVHRWHFMFAKLFAAALFTAAAVLTGFLIALVASAWFSNVYGLPNGTIDLAWLGHALAGLSRTFLSIIPFVVLAVLCATLFRSAGQAVGASLGLFFVESIFTGLLRNAEGWMSHVPEFLVNFNGESIMRANGVVTNQGGDGPFVFGTGDAPAIRAAAVLAAWSLVFIVLVFWRFQRRDIQE